MLPHISFIEPDLHVCGIDTISKDRLITATFLWAVADV